MCEPFVVFIIRVIIAIIGAIVGVAAAFCFGIVFENPHAAAWAATSSVFAVLSLVVILLVHWKKLQEWALVLFALVGATGIILGSTAFVLYIILGIYDKDKPSLPKSYYIVPVWAFMVIKHSIVLTWVTCYEIVMLIRQNRYQQLSTTN